MGMLTEMRYLEIQRDYLTGTIPKELGNWKKIEAFLVTDNFLKGSLPSSFSGHEFLGTIFVQKNDLNGTLAVIPTLKNLEWLEANDNSFTGGLEDISQLKKLSE